MEDNRRIEGIILQEKHIPKILAMGLMLDSILIIFSVDAFYRDGKYLELVISTSLFIGILIIIRRLNFAK